MNEPRSMRELAAIHFQGHTEAKVCCDEENSKTMGVSKNGGTPQIIHFDRVFHETNHPFWGFSPYFWKHPH